jgi:hypothetical protein
MNVKEVWERAIKEVDVLLPSPGGVLIKGRLALLNRRLIAAFGGGYCSPRVPVLLQAPPASMGLAMRVKALLQTAGWKTVVVEEKKGDKRNAKA